VIDLYTYLVCCSVLRLFRRLCPFRLLLSFVIIVLPTLLARGRGSLKLRRLPVFLFLVDSWRELVSFARRCLLLTLLFLVIALVLDCAVIPIIIAETIISIDLLELGGEPLLSLGRRKHLFQLLDGFTHFLFVARIVP
jgi:hypothetical protein